MYYELLLHFHFTIFNFNWCQKFVCFDYNDFQHGLQTSMKEGKMQYSSTQKDYGFI